jgi:hypothetical protein
MTVTFCDPAYCRCKSEGDLRIFSSCTAVPQRKMARSLFLLFHFSSIADNYMMMY